MNEVEDGTADFADRARAAAFELTATAQRLRAELRSTAVERNELRRRCADSERELVGARSEIEALRRDLAAIRASRSWRITAPLRRRSAR